MTKTTGADEELLAAARRRLGTRDDAETVDTALRLIVAADELPRVSRLAESGTVADEFLDYMAAGGLPDLDDEQVMAAAWRE